MDNRDSKRTRLREQWRGYEESETTVAAIFGGIAALFIAGIAAAFLYAKDTNPTQSASASAPSVATSMQTPSGAKAPETTGSGATATPPNPAPSADAQKGRQ